MTNDEEREAQTREIQRIRAVRQREWLFASTPAERGMAYAKFAHAVQSATTFEMNQSQSHSPKHLRTGLNIAMAEFGGLGVLLVSKGIITLAEYSAAMVEGLEAEVVRFEHMYPGIHFE